MKNNNDNNRNNKTKNEKNKKKLRHDSNITWYILAETELTSDNNITPNTQFVFKFSFLFFNGNQLNYFRAKLKYKWI